MKKYKCPNCKGKLIAQDFKVLYMGLDIDIFCCSRCNQIYEENYLDSTLSCYYKQEISNILKDIKTHGYSHLDSIIFDRFNITTFELEKSLFSKSHKRYKLSRYSDNSFIINEDKKNSLNKITSLFPSAKHYVEVFGGPIETIVNKKIYNIETYNDIFNIVFNFFEVLRDENDIEILNSKLKNILLNDNYINITREFWALDRDPVDSALNFYCNGRTFDNNPIFSLNNSFIENVDIMLLPLINKLKTVQIDNRDIEKVLDIYNSFECFLFIDLTYLELYNTYWNKNLTSIIIIEKLKVTNAKFIIISNADLKMYFDYDIHNFILEEKYIYSNYPINEEGVLYESVL